MKRSEDPSTAITDAALETWMDSVAQIIIAILTRRKTTDDDGAQIVPEDPHESSKLHPRQ